ncbi:MAG: gliding motility-associated C-terminal domain-containing protein [Bacteroidales bacterium]|nr:gliding motility-associated C-terminal domain-containing protein [Bacteroidales bacterium]
MKSLIRLGRKAVFPRKGLIALFYLLLGAGALVAQPITVVIQTPDGARDVCQGTTTFILTAYAEGGNLDFVDYQWTADPGMLMPLGDYAIFNNSFASTPGIYHISVTVFDSDGNSGTGQITITLKETPTVSITADGPTTFCFGESVNLIANPINGFEYKWRRNTIDIPGATEPIYQAFESGSYRVRITAANECFSLSNAIDVTVHELPEVTATNDGPVCEGEDLQLSGGPDGMVSYQWSSPSNPGFSSSLQNPVITGITPAQAGQYILTVTDGNGCENSATTTVVVNALPVAPISVTASETHICGGTEGFLTLTATGGSGQTLQWFAGTCGGTPIGQGNNLVIPYPETTTTYYVLWETDDCGQSDCVSVTVNVTEPPEISIISTPISCAGDDDATATVIITGGTPPYSILWSTGATSATIENLGPGTYTVTVTDDAGCIVSEDVTIIEPDAIVLSFSDVVNPVCSGEENGQATVVVSGGTPPFSYLWSNGQTTATATGLAAGNYQVTVTDAAGCEATSSISLTDPPQIVISIVSITHIECHGESTGAVTIIASNGTEPYTYEWDNGETGPSLENIPAGTYMVTVTDANGCQATLSIEINEPEPIEISAGPDQTICEGETATLTASGADTYLWSTGETTATILVAPLVTTTYSVTGFTDCGQGTAQVTVFVLEGPVVDLGNDVEICEGEEATLDAGTFANVSYLWSTGATTQTITVAAGGNYWVTVTNLDNGCSSTDTVAVVLNPLPPAETGPDQTICLGESIILGPTDPVPSPTSTFFWTSVPPDPSLTEPTISNPTVSPTVTTVYTLVETYLDTGCQNENSVTITVVGEAPDAGEDQTICQGESVTLGPETINPGSTYYWTSSNPDEVFDDQVPNPVVTPQITTTYTLFEVVGECTFSDSVTITVNPSPEADAGTDKEICFGESVMIGPDEFTPSPTSIYLWTSVPNDPSISDPTISNPIVSPQVTTVYTLVETFMQTGCSNQNSITVTVYELPEVLIGEDAIICEGESINIGHPEASQDYTYAWTSDPAGFESSESNPMVSPTVTTTYFVTVTSAQGCEDSGQVTITVQPAPVAQVSDDIVFCSESEIEPVHIGGAEVEGYTYQWTSEPEGFESNDANPLVIFEGTTPVTYFLTVTNQYGCTAQYSVTISLSDLMLTTENPDICDDEEALFLAGYVTVTGGTPPYSFRWFDDDSNLLDATPNFIAVAPFFNSYVVEVTDADGCMRMATLDVTLRPAPLVELQVSPPGTAYFGQTITFTAIPPTHDSYDFYVDGLLAQSGTSNIFRSSELKNGQIVYVVATLDGCTGASEPFTVSISGLPNAFTPDGDGINDIFGKDHDLVIFNRWGQLVYEGREGWDGKHNGRDVSPGTYYYILEIVDHNNQTTTLKGSVTVIRQRE